MSTPIFQEALIEAKKLREAATAEAKNAVLEAVSPLIKQMIDKEISGIITEADEPSAPAPAMMSTDPGAKAPIEPVSDAAELASDGSSPAPIASPTIPAGWV